MARSGCIAAALMREAMGADPQAYLADILTRIVNGHPQARIDERFTWAQTATSLKAVGWE